MDLGSDFIISSNNILLYDLYKNSLILDFDLSFSLSIIKEFEFFSYIVSKIVNKFINLTEKQKRKLIISLIEFNNKNNNKYVNKLNLLNILFNLNLIKKIFSDNIIIFKKNEYFNKDGILKRIHFNKLNEIIINILENNFEFDLLPYLYFTKDFSKEKAFYVKEYFKFNNYDFNTILPKISDCKILESLDIDLILEILNNTQTNNLYIIHLLFDKFFNNFLKHTNDKVINNDMTIYIKMLFKGIIMFEFLCYFELVLKTKIYNFDLIEKKKFITIIIKELLLYFNNNDLLIYLIQSANNNKFSALNIDSTAKNYYNKIILSKKYTILFEDNKLDLISLSMKFYDIIKKLYNSYTNKNYIISLRDKNYLPTIIHNLEFTNNKELYINDKVFLKDYAKIDILATIRLNQYLYCKFIRQIKVEVIHNYEDNIVLSHINNKIQKNKFKYIEDSTVKKILNNTKIVLSKKKNTLIHYNKFINEIKNQDLKKSDATIKNNTFIFRIYYQYTNTTLAFNNKTELIKLKNLFYKYYPDSLLDNIFTFGEYDNCIKKVKYLTKKNKLALTFDIKKAFQSYSYETIFKEIFKQILYFDTKDKEIGILSLKILKKLFDLINEESGNKYLYITSSSQILFKLFMFSRLRNKDLNFVCFVDNFIVFGDTDKKLINQFDIIYKKLYIKSLSIFNYFDKNTKVLYLNKKFSK